MERKIYPLMGKQHDPDALDEAHLRLQSSFDILEKQLRQ